MTFCVAFLRTMAWTAFVSLLMAAVSPLSAQTGTASLSGIVTDPSAAVVVNAIVQVVNVETKVSQTTHTNESGIYSFPNLPPAGYRVSVKAPGFKEFVESGVILHVRDTVSLNFK